MDPYVFGIYRLVSHMSTMCSPCAHHMFTICPPCAHHMFTICLPCALQLRFVTYIVYMYKFMCVPVFPNSCYLLHNTIEPCAHHVLTICSAIEICDIHVHCVHVHVHVCICIYVCTCFLIVIYCIIP